MNIKYLILLIVSLLLFSHGITFQNSSERPLDERVLILQLHLVGDTPIDSLYTYAKDLLQSVESGEYYTLQRDNSDYFDSLYQDIKYIVESTEKQLKELEN